MNVTPENVQEHILASKENVTPPEGSEKASWTMCYGSESGERVDNFLGNYKEWTVGVAHTEEGRWEMVHGI